MLRKMKGTYDVTDDIKYMHIIEEKVKAVSRLFSYQEIRTPHFETSELYHRSVGETTDIVSKETYDFEDRGKRMNTLRPEGTAGVVRAFIENKLYANPVTPQKVYYLGSMFRYERPQKGRFREFKQFGAEAFGSNDPHLDAEVIAYAVTLLKALKISDVTVHVNSLGDQESKTHYHKALKEHLKDDIESLCKDCQNRYNDNPLRILDCKVDQDHELIKNAPKPIDYLIEADRLHFEQVIEALKSMQIDVVEDVNLVRGLDYYTHTVFEIKVSKDLLGNQNAICGGGRYNNLIESLEGPATPAVGFAFGIERLIVALKAAEYQVPVDQLHAYIITLGEAAKLKGMALLQTLRLGGLKVNKDYQDKSMKAQFKQSDHQNARYVIILGDEEIQANKAQVKDQTTKEEFSVSMDDVYTFLVERLTSNTCDTCDKGDK